MILLLVILSILIVYLIFSLSQFYNVFFRGYAPFVATDRATIGGIIDEVKNGEVAIKVAIKETPVIYELGCGRARFLKMMAKAFPRAELIGVENLFGLYLLDKIQFKLRRSQIKLLKQDFFTVDLKNADLIYCYLNNATMEKLGEKFRKECRRGTQVVSRSFPIPQFEPNKVLKIRNKQVYFYKV